MSATTGPSHQRQQVRFSVLNGDIELDAYLGEENAKKGYESRKTRQTKIAASSAIAEAPGSRFRTV